MSYLYRMIQQKFSGSKLGTGAGRSVNSPAADELSKSIRNALRVAASSLGKIAVSPTSELEGSGMRRRIDFPGSCSIALAYGLFDLLLSRLGAPKQLQDHRSLGSHPGRHPRHRSVHVRVAISGNRDSAHAVRGLIQIRDRRGTIRPSGDDLCEFELGKVKFWSLA
jgi:hypothetical protein